MKIITLALALTVSFASTVFAEANYEYNKETLQGYECVVRGTQVNLVEYLSLHSGMKQFYVVDDYGSLSAAKEACEISKAQLEAPNCKN